VFENRVLRRIYEPKSVEVIGGRRKLHNEALHNLYFVPSIIRMIKSRKIKWTVHVAQIRDKRNAYRVLMRTPEGKIPVRRLDVGG
jgi:hypothetical protein